MDRPVSVKPYRVLLADEPPFRLGGAQVDPLSREARVGGRIVRLQPQPLKVLCALARRRGQVVTREELIDCCWDGRIVGDDVINRCILLLRGFAEQAGGFAIETVPRAGYRLCETGNAKPEPDHRRWWLLLLLAAIAAGALAFAVLRRPAPETRPELPRVALLPFELSTGDPSLRELARGVSEALTNDLTVSGIPVAMVDRPEAAGAKTTDVLITGDLARVGDKVVVTVQTAETDRHTVLYARRFVEPAKDASTLPAQVGASMATNLTWTGPMMVLDRRHPLPAQTAADLMRNLSLTVEGENMLAAYDIARRAAAHAPGSAIAQLALAMTTAFVLPDLPAGERPSALAAARAAAGQAQKLAPRFGDVFIPWCLLHNQSLLAECEHRLREASKVDPDAPFVGSFLENVLNAVGRNREAAEVTRAAIANDQFRPSKIARMVRHLELADDSAAAQKLFDQAQEWWPHYHWIATSRLVGMIDRGDLAAAERFAATRPADEIPWHPAIARQLFAAARQERPELATGPCRAAKGATSALCMIVFAKTGDEDDAFAIADRLFPRMTANSEAELDRLMLASPDDLPYSLITSHVAAPMRRDPRFLEIAQRVGLLAYWRTVALPDFCQADPEPVCARITAKS